MIFQGPAGPRAPQHAKVKSRSQKSDAETRAGLFDIETGRASPPGGAATLPQSVATANATPAATTTWVRGAGPGPSQFHQGGQKQGPGRPESRPEPVPAPAPLLVPPYAKLSVVGRGARAGGVGVERLLLLQTDHDGAGLVCGGLERVRWWWSAGSCRRCLVVGGGSCSLVVCRSLDALVGVGVSVRSLCGREILSAQSVDSAGLAGWQAGILRESGSRALTMTIECARCVCRQ